MSVDPEGTIVVVGAGLAGSRCAAALRRHGHRGPVLLFGDEHVDAYERPALSKEFLAGAREAGALSAAGTSGDLLRGLGIDVHLGRSVVRLGDGCVQFGDGSRVAFDGLVLATGAAPRRLPGAAAGAAGRIHELRSLQDATTLRDALAPGVRLAIVGSGFVGSEVASTARALGVEVTVLESAREPMATKLGTTASAWLAARWAAAGIDLRCGVEVREISIPPNGHEVRIDTDTGRIDADHVLVAIGTVARDGLFHAAWPSDLPPGAGIPVDADGRTSVPGVWAVGDVACRTTVSGAARRNEHWTDAANDADRVARSIAGRELPRAHAPYAWSDQFGIRIQIAGTVGGDLRHVVEHDGLDDLLVRYQNADGIPVGVLGIGHPVEVAASRTSFAA